MMAKVALILIICTALLGAKTGFGATTQTTQLR